MKYLIAAITMCVATFLPAQSNIEFRAALASEVQQMVEGETIVVKYKKTGCWGDYEGGYLRFTQEQSNIVIELENTNQHFKASEISKTLLTKKELLNRLNSDQKDEIGNEENTVYSNYIEYQITKNGVSLAVIRSTIEPNQVTNKVGLVPQFQDFMNKGKSKKPGILINNISGE